MLSRVANSIYWLNRYIERAENVARFVDVNLNLMLDVSGGLTQQWEPLVLTTGDLPLFQERYGKATGENVTRFLTFDPNYPNSILSCVQMARENARSVREIISSQMWEEVNGFYYMVREAAERRPQIPLPSFFNQVKIASHRFAGVMNATMTHSEGWHFGEMGRLLERADKTARILDVKYFYLLPSVQSVGTPLDQIQWIALLKSASAYEMYRKSQHRINPSSVVEFLVLNRRFPRAIHFCIRQAQNCLHEITGTPRGTWSNSVERSLGRLCAELDYLIVEDVVNVGLHEFLDKMQNQINGVGSKVATTFFGVEPANEGSVQYASQSMVS